MNASMISTAAAPRATTATITTIRSLDELAAVRDLLTAVLMVTDSIGAHEGGPLNEVISHALVHLATAEDMLAGWIDEVAK